MAEEAPAPVLERPNDQSPQPGSVQTIIDQGKSTNLQKYWQESATLTNVVISDKNNPNIKGPIKGKEPFRSGEAWIIDDNGRQHIIPTEYAVGVTPEDAERLQNPHAVIQRQMASFQEKLNALDRQDQQVQEIKALAEHDLEGAMARAALMKNTAPIKTENQASIDPNVAQELVGQPTSIPSEPIPVSSEQMNLEGFLKGLEARITQQLPTRSTPEVRNQMLQTELKQFSREHPEVIAALIYKQIEDSAAKGEVSPVLSLSAEVRESLENIYNTGIIDRSFPLRAFQEKAAEFIHASDEINSPYRNLEAAQLLENFLYYLNSTDQSDLYKHIVANPNYSSTLFDGLREPIQSRYPNLDQNQLARYTSLIYNFVRNPFYGIDLNIDGGIERVLTAKDALISLPQYTKDIPLSQGTKLSDDPTFQSFSGQPREQIEEEPNSR